MSAVPAVSPSSSVLRRRVLLALAVIVSLEVFPAARLWQSPALLVLGVSVVAAISAMTTPWAGRTGWQRTWRVTARSLLLLSIGFVVFAVPFVLEAIGDDLQKGD